MARGAGTFDATTEDARGAGTFDAMTEGTGGAGTIARDSVGMAEYAGAAVVSGSMFKGSLEVLRL
jgi:hypothetical protein